MLSLTGCAAQDGSAPSSPVSGFTSSDDDGLAGVVLPTPYAVPRVALDDAAGHPTTLRAMATKPLTLVFFGYTNCPDICQVVMANIASALVRLPPAQRGKVGMVFVTTDPRRDTAPVLRRYLDRFNPSFDGLTGDLGRVVRLGRSMDVEIDQGHKLASGGYDVTHGTQIVGLLPDGPAPFVWTEGTSPASLTTDIGKILEDKVPGL